MKLDNPITTHEHDRLGRSGFAKKLELALLKHCDDCNGKKATGAVVGLVGKWGSGKTSVANMLNEHLDEDAECINFVFTPWLVDSGSRLIEYFSECLFQKLPANFPIRCPTINSLLICSLMLGSPLIS